MLNLYHGKKTKVADLGSISSLGYNHGEASAMAAVVTLTSPWANNCPIFSAHGNFGSRLITDAAAPRYIYASLSPEFKKYFLDSEVAPKSSDPDSIIPAHYLPTIPWVLVNGVEGIAVGFATKFLPRSIKTLVGEVTRCLKDPIAYAKANKDIVPTYPDFRGTVTKGDETNQWLTTGIVEYIGKYTYRISELPIGYDRESYISVLHDMIDTDKAKDFDDECSEAGFGFTVKLTPSQKEKAELDPIKYFKLVKPKTENLTTIGHDGQLKIFDSPSQLVSYFVEYRLTKFSDKLDYQKKNILLDIEEMQDRVKFINDVINHKIDFRVLSKTELLSYIDAKITVQQWGKAFINIPLYNCTKDSIESLMKKINDADLEYKELLTETPLSRYLKVIK
jgi:DNA topoisomerase-2